MSDWLSAFSFQWWWAWLALPLPWFVYRFWPPLPKPGGVQIGYLSDSESSPAQASPVLKLLLCLSWFMLIAACARPIWLGDPITFHPKQRDLMLVVDLSGSMAQEDMKLGDEYIDRLSATKTVLKHFIQKRQGDRLGLILFADHAYLQTPLTFDRQTIEKQLDRTVIGLVGQQTALGDGIGLATKTFIDDDAPQRVMIVLSDGSNNAGVLSPNEAAQLAKKYHATIYTVGLGAGEMLVKQFFMTRKVNTAEDLDEKTLQQVADLTGGQYFRARDTEDLEQIYNTINQLEPVTGQSQTWRPQTDWFHYPLAASLVLSLIVFAWRRLH